MIDETENIYVGIDLGTVNSCVAVWKNGKAEIFETGDGKILPSFVCYDPKSDRIQVGKPGLVDVDKYKSGIYDAKRFIGRNFSDPIVQRICKSYPFNIHGNSKDKVLFSFTHKTNMVEKTPEEVVPEILKYIKNCLEIHYKPGTKINAVVTVPAYFNNEQREATRRASKNAGLSLLGLMKEPTAAALQFFDSNKDAEGLTVVFDLGGGTFDVSIVEKNGLRIDVKGYDGDNFLGGRNFEEKILNELLKDFDRQKKVLNDLQKSRLQQAIKHIKEKISTKMEAKKEIENFLDEEDFLLSLTRTKFEKLNSSLFQSCIDVLDRCLRKHKISKWEIKNVVMVGGSTKIPKIQEAVRDYFGSEPVFNCIDPDLSVALGAAIFAFHLANTDNTLDEFPIYEVCSMSIGKKISFNYLNPVINRNTGLPVKKTIRFATSMNYLENCVNEWFEGNFVCASKNHYLGKIEHKNLPKRKAGEIHFEDTVEVDSDNILKITSKVLETNQIETIILPLHNKHKDDEIEDVSSEWTQSNDDNFERLALIKLIFYNYYRQFSCIRKFDSNYQNGMYRDLYVINDLDKLVDEINNFVSNFYEEKSECLLLMNELLQSVNLPIEKLREMKNNVKKNLKS